MTTKTRRKRYENRECPTGKRKFQSRMHATLWMTSSRTANIRPYYCRLCSHWHTTSRV